MSHICIICNSKTTFTDRDKRYNVECPRWYKIKQGKGYLCHNCYCRLVLYPRHKDYHKQYNERKKLTRRANK